MLAPLGTRLTPRANQYRAPDLGSTQVNTSYFGSDSKVATLENTATDPRMRCPRTLFRALDVFFLAENATVLQPTSCLSCRREQQSDVIIHQRLNNARGVDSVAGFMLGEPSVTGRFHSHKTTAAARFRSHLHCFGCVPAV